MNTKVRMADDVEPVYVSDAAAFAKVAQAVEHKIESFYVESMGAFVWLRHPTALARGEFEGRFVGEGRAKAIATMKIDLCQMVICDEKGNLIFPTRDSARKTLGPLDAEIVTEISQRAESIMKITKEDIEEAIENF